jgi:hypothetical protein
MAKPTIAPTPKAEPVAAPLTEAHRASAAAAGMDLGGLLATRAQSLSEARHGLIAIVNSAPAGDSNVSALLGIERRVCRLMGEIDLFAPPMRGS